MKALKNRRGRAIRVLAAAVLVFGACTAPVSASVPARSGPQGPETVLVVSAGGSGSIRGSATFYCNSDRRRTVLSKCHHSYPDRPGTLDLYAAAGPAIRRALGDWRGKYVLVSRKGHGAVKVRLIDFCACGSAVIDLYADAMWRLGGSGRIAVTVSWGGSPKVPTVLPATDTEYRHGGYGCRQRPS